MKTLQIGDVVPCKLTDENPADRRHLAATVEPSSAYRQRVVDDELDDLLAAVGCVVIEGPKAVGKTVTGSRRAATTIRLDVDANARQLAQTAPHLLVRGAAPILIDEWQLVPAVWNHVRRSVDERGKPGQFILTGSAEPADDTTRHSGAGRMARLRMRPMSLVETGHSTGEVSLAKLLDGEQPAAGASDLTIETIIDRICIGGWPSFVDATPTEAQRGMRQYVEELTRSDIRMLDGVRRDPMRLARVLRSLARHVGTAASTSTIAADVGGDDEPMKRETVRDYLDALRRVMVVEDVRAWAPALRSRARLRAAATRYMTDPCLAVAALNASPERLLRDLEWTGLLFENLVVRDLRVYCQRGELWLHHYRDSNGLEVDVILESADGRWAGLEIKLGSHQTDAAASNLVRFADTVDTSRIGEPTFLAVVTGTGYAYQREDGVLVLPIGHLGP